MTRKEWIADGILTLTALIWGTGFVVMKNTLSSVPPAAIIAIRYTIAAALTAVLFRRHLKGVAGADVARGVLVGLLLALAYIVQTIGLKYTTAGKNAFLTTVYVLTEHRRPADDPVRRVLCGTHHGCGALPAQNEHLCADRAAIRVCGGVRRGVSSTL